MSNASGSKLSNVRRKGAELVRGTAQAAGAHAHRAAARLARAGGGAERGAAGVHARLSAVFPRTTLLAEIETELSIGRELGRGRSSVVCEAMEHSTGKLRALKAISTAVLASDSDELDALVNEVRMMARMPPHPHVVALHRVVCTPEMTCLVLDLVAGGDLLGPIERGGAYSEPTARALFAQLLLALEHVHACGVAHRDLKPENVCFVASPTSMHLKLVDFGLAELTDGGSDMRGLAGTAVYAAPEVLAWWWAEAEARGEDVEAAGPPPAAPAAPYGLACDVWAAGVCLYAMLTAQLPFAQELPLGELHGATTAGPEMPAEHWAHLSAEAAQLVRAMLAFDPQRRPTVSELLMHPWCVAQSGAAAGTRAACALNVDGVTARVSVRIELFPRQAVAPHGHAPPRAPAVPPLAAARVEAGAPARPPGAAAPPEARGSGVDDSASLELLGAFAFLPYAFAPADGGSAERESAPFVGAVRFRVHWRHAPHGAPYSAAHGGARLLGAVHSRLRRTGRAAGGADGAGDRWTAERRALLERPDPSPLVLTVCVTADGVYVLQGEAELDSVERALLPDAGQAPPAAEAEAPAAQPRPAAPEITRARAHATVDVSAEGAYALLSGHMSAVELAAHADDEEAALAFGRCFACEQGAFRLFCEARGLVCPPVATPRGAGAEGGLSGAEGLADDGSRRAADVVARLPNLQPRRWFARRPGESAGAAPAAATSEESAGQLGDEDFLASIPLADAATGATVSPAGSSAIEQAGGGEPAPSLPELPPLPPLPPELAGPEADPVALVPAADGEPSTPVASHSARAAAGRPHSAGPAAALRVRSTLQSLEERRAHWQRNLGNWRKGGAPHPSGGGTILQLGDEGPAIARDDAALGAVPAPLGDTDAAANKAALRSSQALSVDAGAASGMEPAAYQAASFADNDEQQELP